MIWELQHHNNVVVAYKDMRDMVQVKEATDNRYLNAFLAASLLLLIIGYLRKVIGGRSQTRIKLQSGPGGGSISLLQFYTNTYPLRLKEPFEKQLKKSSAVSTYNRQHYEDRIKKIDSNY